jgi:hypothetical protein
MDTRGGWVRVWGPLDSALAVLQAPAGKKCCRLDILLLSRNWADERLLQYRRVVSSWVDNLAGSQTSKLSIVMLLSFFSRSLNSSCRTDMEGEGAVTG